MEVKCIVILKKIRDLCDKKRITVSELERACGIGNATISRWDKSFPRVDKLKAVADYLHVSIEELLEEKDVENERQGSETK